MKTKKKKFPLWRKLLYTALFILFTGLFIFLGTKDYNNAPKNKISEQEQFASEYGIEENNKFTYVNGKKVQELLNSENAIIFFAFPQNEWSKKYAEILNDAVKDNKEIDKVYYYNFKLDRESRTSYYENIVNKLSYYLSKSDTNVQNINAPTLVVLKDKKIIYYDDETSTTKSNETKEIYWTEEKIAKKIKEFKEIFEANKDEE